ncbi:putative TetR transcriptional regulator [Indibacter alkaliphilus LW1]|uniref:TetR transcriptional regulator n=1 Tax=Indibacter alkaliphilus (strain CCUG 57479 / KCTC 22604 / LW1) TaxID=1189612 RepID=S2DEX7_INDAL|nr:TetR/AcrR family transcriptional regulator [Indibacter alkaliphilus]EOZ95545.1 putative TetR transcriptional regulator [Indibacter alkaliphilus LW1]
METREKIIETATEQFMRFGVRSVTMDDIARQAGVSKKTIYQEFSDKNQLVYETFEKAIQGDKCHIERFPQSKIGVIEHLVQLSRYMRERFANLNPMVLNEIQRYFPQSWQLFENFKRDFVLQEIIELLEEGKKQGFFRPEINSEILGLMRLEQMMLSFDPIKFPPAKYNIVDLQLEIFEHFLYGIFTEKGKEAYLNQKNTAQHENHN